MNWWIEYRRMPLYQYVECHCTKRCFTECHYTECRCTECRCTERRCTECRSTECRCTEWRYAKCQSTECRCAKCRSTERRCTMPFRFSEMAYPPHSPMANAECRIINMQTEKESKRERKIQKQFCLSVSCPSFFTLSQMHSLKLHQKHSLSLSLSRFITQTTGWRKD